MTDNRTICLENGDPLGEDLLSMTPEQLKLVEREEKITDVEFKTEAVSYGKDVWRRFVRSKVTIVSLVIILLIILMGIIGPYLSPHDYLEQNLALKNMPPRVQGLEKLGILDGSQVIEIQEGELENYADCIIENLGTFEVKSAFGTGTMVRLNINLYE